MRKQFTNNDDIRQCPHCGGDAYICAETSKENEWFVFVRCSVCGSTGKKFMAYDGEPTKHIYDDLAIVQAVNAWNMRYHGE